MSKLKKIVDKAADCIAIISYISLAVLMLMNVADILLSKILGFSISGAYEISECVLMCAVFAAFAYGQTQKTHVHMTLFLTKMPGKLKFVVNFLGYLLSLTMCCLLTYATGIQMMRQLTKHQVTGIIHIPYFPFYLVAFICLIVFILTILYDVIVAFLAIFKPKYGDEVTSAW